ncbi:MAG: hypothetical protein EPN33_13680 [Acidobacteria bacterium]|nr:MAG: hypothetical protein EPN33_13680 [Acidobacteriota bacterium]
MKRLVVLGVLGGLAVLAIGCQQPYQVFAVQIAKAAPTTTATAAADPPPDGQQPRVKKRKKRSERQKWDVNRVPASTLMELPDISRATVAAMMAGRPYKAKRELLKRGILTPAQYAKWKGELVVHRPDSRTR